MFSHSLSLDNNIRLHETYTENFCLYFLKKLLLSRCLKGTCYLWRVHATFEGYMLPLKGTCYLWRVHATFEGYMLPLKGTYYLWRVHTTFEGYTLPLKGTYYLWSVHTTFEGYILPLKGTHYLWRVHTTFEGYILPLKGTYYLWTAGNEVESLHSSLTCVPNSLSLEKNSRLHETTSLLQFDKITIFISDKKKNVYKGNEVYTKVYIKAIRCIQRINKDVNKGKSGVYKG